MYSETNLLEDDQLRVPTCIDTYGPFLCAVLVWNLNDLADSPSFFLPLLIFVFSFLAGSTTCKNPEESHHVRLLPWAWCVRHQRPFPAGKDTSSHVYVAGFKSDIGCSGTSELQIDMPPSS